MSLDVQRLLREGCLTHVEHHGTLTSTNDRAREIARELPTDETALVIADEQTAGARGGVPIAGGLGPGVWHVRWCSIRPRRGFAGSIIRSSRWPQPWRSSTRCGRSCRPVHSACTGPTTCLRRVASCQAFWSRQLPDGKHVLGVGLNVNNRAAGAAGRVARSARLRSPTMAGGEQSRTDVLLEVLGRLWPNLGQLAVNAAEMARRADRACLQHGRTLVIESGDRRVRGSLPRHRRRRSAGATYRSRRRKVLLRRADSRVS